MSTPEPLTPLSGDIGTPPPVAQPAPIAAPPTPGQQHRQQRSDMELRRERLAGELAQLQWDLGGLTYEMAIRDHFRLDVLTHQAGLLQRVDAELAETERLLALDESSAAGACPVCAALYARGAGFCWRCGTPLLAPGGAGPAPAAGAPGAGAGAGHGHGHGEGVPGGTPLAVPVVQPTMVVPAVDPHEPATQAFTPVSEHEPATQAVTPVSEHVPTDGAPALRPGSPLDDPSA